MQTQIEFEVGNAAQNPRDRDCLRGAKQVRSMAADAVGAVGGGGSAMDSAAIAQAFGYSAMRTIAQDD